MKNTYRQKVAIIRYTDEVSGITYMLDITNNLTKWLAENNLQKEVDVEWTTMKTY